MNNQNCRMTKKMWQQIILATSLMLATLGSQAQTTPAIEAVSGSIQGGVEVVKIDLNQFLDTFFSEVRIHPALNNPEERLFAVFRCLLTADSPLKGQVERFFGLP